MTREGTIFSPEGAFDFVTRNKLQPTRLLLPAGFERGLVIGLAYAYDAVFRLALLHSSTTSDGGGDDDDPVLGAQEPPPPSFLPLPPPSPPPTLLYQSASSRPGPWISARRPQKAQK